MANAQRFPVFLLRLLGAGGLVFGLFWVGIHDEAFFAWLTASSQHLFRALGLAEQVASLQQGVSGAVTTRSLPVMLLYGLLYTGSCLLLIWLALFQKRAFRLALYCYAGVFGACVLLLLGGKLLGDAVWAYQLGRRLIDFIVSPLPVIILVPLLRWYPLPTSAPAEPHRAQ